MKIRGKKRKAAAIRKHGYPEWVIRRVLLAKGKIL